MDKPQLTLKHFYLIHLMPQNIVLPDVSLAAIVRDEIMNPAGGIVDFVESVIPFLEEAVIVDTGSVDGTREALEELGVSINNEKHFATCELPEFNIKLTFVLCNVESGKISIKEPKEIDKIEWMTFEEFFERFSDDQIGHGLIWLRKNSEVWKRL